MNIDRLRLPHHDWRIIHSASSDGVQAELDRLMRCMSYGLALRNLTPKVQLEVFRYHV